MSFFTLILSHGYGEFSRVYMTCDIATDWMLEQVWEARCLLLRQTLKRSAKMYNKMCHSSHQIVCFGKYSYFSLKYVIYVNMDLLLIFLQKQIHTLHFSQFSVLIQTILTAQNYRNKNSLGSSMIFKHVTILKCLGIDLLEAEVAGEEVSLSSPVVCTPRG